MRLMQAFLRIFFQLLYHSFAWTYDLVAWTVSLGRWQSWVRCAQPYLRGPVLELGFGPGHLQTSLLKAGMLSFGLDESPQMTRHARRRLARQALPIRLARGLAQKIPLANESLANVVATFPSEYIFEPATLREIRRVLAPDGQLVLVASAWITARAPLARLAAWLFRLTGQAAAIDLILPKMKRALSKYSFVVSHTLVELPGSRVLVLLARKE